MFSIYIESKIKKFKELAEIENMRFGQICASIFNAARNKKGKRYKASDFFKSFAERKKQSLNDMDSVLRAWTEQMGGVVNE